MEAYRRGFQPADAGGGPEALVAVGVICAETDAEAVRLARSAEVWGLRPEGTDRGPLLSPTDAAARTLTEIEEAKVAQGRAARVVGSPARVRDGLISLAESYGVDELMLLTVCHDPEARRRSYELVAEALAG